MGELRDRMEGDLLLKGVAEVTRTEYVRCAFHLAAYYRRSPAALGADQGRAYLLHLTGDLHYSPANLKMQVAALKFLYTVALNRPEVVEKIPYPKVPRVLLVSGSRPVPVDGVAHPAPAPDALLPSRLHRDDTADDPATPTLRCPNCQGTTFALIATLFSERRRKCPPPDT